MILHKTNDCVVIETTSYGYIFFQRLWNIHKTVGNYSPQPFNHILEHIDQPWQTKIRQDENDCLFQLIIHHILEVNENNEWNIHPSHQKNLLSYTGIFFRFFYGYKKLKKYSYLYTLLFFIIIIGL